MTGSAVALARAGRLRQRRHRRVPARHRHRRGLLPGDEHPAPGRAPGHRAGVTRGQLDLVALQLRVADGRAARADPGRHPPRRARDRGPGLRRGRVPRLPAAGRHRLARPLAGPGPCRRRARERAGGVDRVRPDAGQGDRARAGPRVRPACPRRRPRRHRDPRLHHERRLPAGARGLGRVPRRDHRHGLARHRVDRRRRASGSRRRPRPDRGGVDPGDAGRHGLRERHPAPLPVRRVPARRGAGAAPGRARPGGAGRPGARRGRRCPGHRAVGRAARRAPQVAGHRHAGRRERDRARGRGGARGPALTCSTSPTSFADSATAVGDGAITAPMPGTVLAVDVARGRAVEEGADARRAGGDEDGARAQGAVRRHRHPGRRRRPASRWLDGRRAVRWWSREGECRADVTIYEVGPRDGLQNEKGIVPVEAKAEFIHRLARRRAAGRGGDQLRAPDVGAAAGRRRRADGDADRGARRARPAAARCWSPTSAASTAPSSSAASTSRSSAARPRPSRSATSTAAWTSSSRCSSPRSPGPATPGSTSAPT